MLLVGGEGWNRDGAYPLLCCAPPYPWYGNLEVSHCWTVVTWPWIIRSNVVWVVRATEKGKRESGWVGTSQALSSQLQDRRNKPARPHKTAYFVSLSDEVNTAAGDTSSC